MTLNGRPLRILFQKHASVGGHRENLNEDRPTVSGAESAIKLQPNASVLFPVEVKQTVIKLR